ncbi:MAG: hypothetical protein RBT11_19665 [Desulfobacterales bacterium]|jgi:hypothetical protein|nr:hypothetical protein [Desulfobacterales bacterium]
MAKFQLGENIEGEVNGDKLTLEIDLSHRGQRSASGKTVRVSSTCGNVNVPGTMVTVGINAYTK